MKSCRIWLMWQEEPHKQWHILVWNAMWNEWLHDKVKLNLLKLWSEINSTVLLKIKTKNKAFTWLLCCVFIYGSSTHIGELNSSSKIAGGKPNGSSSDRICEVVGLLERVNRCMMEMDVMEWSTIWGESGVSRGDTVNWVYKCWKNSSLLWKFLWNFSIFPLTINVN